MHPLLASYCTRCTQSLKLYICGLLIEVRKKMILKPDRSAKKVADPFRSSRHKVKIPRVQV